MYAADGILGSVTGPATAVQLLLHVQDSAKSACSVRTGYVFFGTLVLHASGTSRLMYQLLTTKLRSKRSI